MRDCFTRTVPCIVTEAERPWLRSAGPGKRWCVQTRRPRTHGPSLSSQAQEPGAPMSEGGRRRWSSPSGQSEFTFVHSSLLSYSQQVGDVHQPTRVTLLTYSPDSNANLYPKPSGTHPERTCYHLSGRSLAQSS